MPELSFKIKDSRGKAAVENLRLKALSKFASERAAIPMQSAMVEPGESVIEIYDRKKEHSETHADTTRGSGASSRGEDQSK